MIWVCTGAVARGVLQGESACKSFTYSPAMLGADACLAWDSVYGSWPQGIAHGRCRWKAAFALWRTSRPGAGALVGIWSHRTPLKSELVHY